MGDLLPFRGLPTELLIEIVGHALQQGVSPLDLILLNRSLKKIIEGAGYLWNNIIFDPKMFIGEINYESVNWGFSPGAILLQCGTIEEFNLLSKLSIEYPLNLLLNLKGLHGGGDTPAVFGHWRRSVRSLIIEGDSISQSYNFTFEDLQYLSVREPTQEGLATLFQRISVDKGHLTKLEISFDTSINFEDSSILSCNIWSKLQSLVIRNQVNSEEEVNLTAILQLCENLESLYISGLACHCFHSLENGELHFPKLKKLQLINVEFKTPEFVRFPSNIFPRLEQLSVLSNKPPLVSLTHHFSIYGRLNFLALGPNLEALSRPLNLPCLTHLELHGADESKLKLISAPKLTYLSLNCLWSSFHEGTDLVFLTSIFGEEKVLGPLLGLQHLVLQHISALLFSLKGLIFNTGLESITFHAVTLPYSFSEDLAWIRDKKFLPNLRNIGIDQRCLYPINEIKLDRALERRVKDEMIIGDAFWLNNNDVILGDTNFIYSQLEYFLEYKAIGVWMWECHGKEIEENREYLDKLNEELPQFNFDTKDFPNAPWYDVVFPMSLVL